MKRIVKYKAIDPYYSDITQDYIGNTWGEVDMIQYETEEYMAQYHTNLSSIYKIEHIEEYS